MKVRINTGDIESMVKGDSSAYHRLSGSVKAIILSRLASFPDIKNYMDDLVLGSFVILWSSYRNFDKSKASFSTYSFNRIVSAAKRQYLALKYPYGGIKRLSGLTKKEQDSFIQSDIAQIYELDSFYNDIPSLDIDNIDSSLSVYLTDDEISSYKETIEGLLGRKGAINQNRVDSLRKIVKERMEVV